MGNMCSVLVSKDVKCMDECIAWAEEAKIKNIYANLEEAIWISY